MLVDKGESPEYDGKGIAHTQKWLQIGLSLAILGNKGFRENELTREARAFRVELLYGSLRLITESKGV
jgi:hypothetical protein